MARKKATQVNPKIVLVDVNTLLHVGDKAPHSKNWSVSDVNGNKFRTGGLTAVLNVIRRADYDINRDIFVFCFDRRTFRKQRAHSMGVDYKGGREKMSPSLVVQSDLLFEWLPKMGFNAIGLDGLEADDIIYSIVHHSKEYGIGVDIISTDRDLTVNINENIRLVSPNSKVSSVDFSNFEYTIGQAKGHTIPYNTILLYKSICGDDSDKIPSIVRQPYAMYRKIINKLRDIKYDLPSLSDPEKVKDILMELDEEVRDKALNNLELITPFLLPNDQVPMKRLEINLDAILQFSAIVGSKLFAKKFGLDISNIYSTNTANTYQSNGTDYPSEKREVTANYPELVMKTRLELTKKVGELSSSSDYGKSMEEDVKTSDALQAITDIEDEEKYYKNVGIALVQNTQTQSLENEQTPRISTDALE